MTAHEHDRNPHDSRPGRRRRNTIKGAFSGRTVEMLNSPAWRVLSLAARRVIDRVSIELRYHGGHQKAGLPVTYKQFIDYGIGDRNAVAPAIREAVALGFLEIVRQGRAGNAEDREPTRYRLTFEHHTDCEPEHFRWRKIRELERAQAIKAQARADSRKKQKPVRDSQTDLGRDSHTGVGRVSHTENRNILGRETQTTSNILPRGGRSGGGGGEVPALRADHRRADASQTRAGRVEATQTKTGNIQTKTGSQTKTDPVKPSLVMVEASGLTRTGSDQGVIRRRVRSVSSRPQQYDESGED
jgi:hypothetical protein